MSRDVILGDTLPDVAPNPAPGLHGATPEPADVAALAAELTALRRLAKRVWKWLAAQRGFADTASADALALCAAARRQVMAELGRVFAGRPGPDDDQAGPEPVPVAAALTAEERAMLGHALYLAAVAMRESPRVCSRVLALAEKLDVSDFCTGVHKLWTDPAKEGGGP